MSVSRETFWRVANRAFIQAAPYYGWFVQEDVCLMDLPCAKASATEEPDAGKPQVRDCAGGTG